MRPFGRSDAGRDLSETATGAAVDLQDALNVASTIAGCRAALVWTFGLEDRPIDAAIALERDPLMTELSLTRTITCDPLRDAHRSNIPVAKIAARLLGEPARSRR